MEAIIFANLAGYIVVAAGGLLIGTMFGGKFTAAVMSTVHGLEGRISTIEGAATANKASAVTGTVVVAPSEHETRMASLLPRVHVIAIPRDALVETPGDVLRDLPRWGQGAVEHR